MKPGYRARSDQAKTFLVFATFSLLCLALALWGAS
jgi:hypothetical protein